jgi:hypothetical protein
MNMTIIRQMVRDGDVNKNACDYLLNCRGECEWLDYKEVLHLEVDKHRYNFGKDALGITNRGGVSVVIGVEDKTWKPVGLVVSLTPLIININTVYVDKSGLRLSL